MICGSCLCGTIRYEIDGRISDIGQCHCSKCRKAFGTGASAVFYVATASFKWAAGESEIQAYKTPSGYGTAFCRQCGSPVPHAATNGKIYFVPAGTLDDDPEKRGIAVHLYVDSAAPWHEITDAAPKHREGFDSDLVD